MANGTCGNINHLDFSWSWPQGTGARADIASPPFSGAAVFQAYKDLKPVAAGPLRAKSRTRRTRPARDHARRKSRKRKQTVAATKDDRGATS